MLWAMICYVVQWCETLVGSYFILCEHALCCANIAGWALHIGMGNQHDFYIRKCWHNANTLLEKAGNGVAASKTSFTSYFDILNTLRRRQDFVFVKQTTQSLLSSPKHISSTKPSKLNPIKEQNRWHTAKIKNKSKTNRNSNAQNHNSTPKRNLNVLSPFVNFMVETCDTIFGSTFKDHPQGIASRCPKGATVEDSHGNS